VPQEKEIDSENASKGESENPHQHTFFPGL